MKKLKRVMLVTVVFTILGVIFFGIPLAMAQPISPVNILTDVATNYAYLPVVHTMATGMAMIVSPQVAKVASVYGFLAFGGMIGIVAVVLPHVGLNESDDES
jgi:hypothetical protein